MNYYPHHIGDYAQATAHLSWDEDMAYTRLLRKYYQDEKPIPKDLGFVCRLMRATTAEQKAAIETVLNEFFVLRDDGWHQDRCNVEISAYQAKADKARENGQKGGRKSNASKGVGAVPRGTKPNTNQTGTNPVSERLPDAKRQPAGSQANQNHNHNEKNKDIGGSGDPAESKDFSADFLKAWEIYPKRMGDNPKRMAFQCWTARIKQGSTAVEMHAGVQRYAAFCTAKGDIGTNYVMQATRFFGPDTPFRNEWAYTPPAPKPGAQANNPDAERAWLELRECLSRGRAPTTGALGEAYRVIGGSRLMEITSFEVNERKAAFIAAWMKESQKLPALVADLAASLVKPV